MYLTKRLKELFKYPFVGDTRGVGLFQGIDIVKDRASKAEDGETARLIIVQARKLGVLVSRDGVHHNILKVKPPIIFGRAHVDQMMKTLHLVMENVSKSRATARL